MMRTHTEPSHQGEWNGVGRGGGTYDGSQHEGKADEFPRRGSIDAPVIALSDGPSLTARSG